MQCRHRGPEISSRFLFFTKFGKKVADLGVASTTEAAPEAPGVGLTGAAGAGPVNVRRKRVVSLAYVLSDKIKEIVIESK